MTFKQWIYDAGGPGVLSKKLKVTRRIIELWAKGQSTPNLHAFHKMQELSAGYVSYELIRKGLKKKTKRIKATSVEAQT